MFKYALYGICIFVGRGNRGSIWGHPGNIIVTCLSSTVPVSSNPVECIAVPFQSLSIPCIYYLYSTYSTYIPHIFSISQFLSLRSWHGRRRPGQRRPGRSRRPGAQVSRLGAPFFFSGPSGALGIGMCQRQALFSFWAFETEKGDQSTRMGSFRMLLLWMHLNEVFSIGFLWRVLPQGVNLRKRTHPKRTCKPVGLCF